MVAGGYNTLDVEKAKWQVHVLNRQVTSTFQGVLASCDHAVYFRIVETCSDIPVSLIPSGLELSASE